jgi:hypothetical protein
MGKRAVHEKQDVILVTPTYTCATMAATIWLGWRLTSTDMHKPHGTNSNSGKEVAEDPSRGHCGPAGWLPAGGLAGHVVSVHSSVPIRNCERETESRKQELEE